MKTIYKSFLLASAFTALATFAQAQEDATMVVKKNAATPATTAKPVVQSANGVDLTMQTKPASQTSVTNRPAVTHSTTVDATNGTQVTATTTTVKTVNKTTTVKRTGTPLRTTYTEGKLKGQPVPAPSANRPAADPAKLAAEKAKADAARKAHPAHTTKTTAAEKAAYPAKRAAELKANNQQK